MREEDKLDKVVGVVTRGTETRSTVVWVGGVSTVSLDGLYEDPRRTEY